MWEKLEYRLKAIANDHAGKVQAPCKVVHLELFIRGDRLVGWKKPEVIAIEPRNIDPIHLNAKRVTNSWIAVIDQLKEYGEADLVIYRGEPYGWLNGSL